MCRQALTSIPWILTLMFRVFILLCLWVGIYEQIELVWQILCLWCTNSGYGNVKHPRAFIPPSLSGLSWWQARSSFQVLPCGMQRTGSYSVFQLWNKYYPKVLEHLDSLLAHEVSQRASSAGNLSFFVMHLSEFASALYKGRNFRYNYHIQFVNFTFKLGSLKMYKSKLVQSCSPVKSIIISENKIWRGHCQIISVQSVLLFSDWVQSQSRENWEERHGLSQGKLRIQPAQQK